MTPVLFVDAVHTAYRLGWALVVWIVLTAAAVTLALYTVAVTVWWLCRGLWRAGRAAVGARRGPRGPSWRRGRLRARIFARTHARRSSRSTRPRWAHTQPIDHDDYREAA